MTTEAGVADVPTVLDVVPPTDVRTDVPRDVHDAGAVALFTPCAATTACTGIPSARCLTVNDGYPMGHCTRSCTSDSQCGAAGICLPFGTVQLCFQRCDAPTDCRGGYNCFVGRGSGDTAESACFPFCSTDAQCPGATCNLYSRFCGTLDTSRAENGQPCTAATDCRSGRCFTEFNTTTGDPTGSLGGQCYSRCIIPPDSAYAGTTYPQGDCPAHSVCERLAGQVAGGPGLCRDECSSASDCRPGYICVKAARGTDGGTTSNGYCAAMNCHYMTQTCPSVATCRTLASDDAGVPTSGICVANPGADGATQLWS